MLKKVCVVVVVLIAVIQGLAGLEGTGGEVMMLLLALTGIVYAAVAIDAEDPTAFCVVAVAVGLAVEAEVLSHIHLVGEYLHAIVDPVTVALYAGVITILVVRTMNRLKE